MSDLINREDAIDTALTFLVEYCGAAFDEDMQKILCERLDALPSAEPERKWIPVTEALPEEEKDRIICDCIDGALDGLYRHAYNYEPKPRTNEANIAIDIWAKLDGRREDGFSFGTEPLVQVKEVEE